MAFKRMSLRAERKESAKAMVRLQAIDIFQKIERFELSFDQMKNFRKEIIELTKKQPEVVLTVATDALRRGMGYIPKIQTFVLVSEVLIKAGKKQEPEVKAANFKNLLSILENPRLVRRQSLTAMNPNYLNTILEGIDSLKIKSSDRRFLRVIGSFGYGDRRQSLVHSLESLSNNKIYTSGEYKGVSKYAKKLVKKLK